MKVHFLIFSFFLMVSIQACSTHQLSEHEAPLIGRNTFSINKAQVDQGLSDKVLLAEFQRDEIHEIINGRASVLNDWPATFKIESGGAPCTSTLVGSGTVLTAAHCIQKFVPTFLLYEQKLVKIKCERHPEYEWREYLDFALCEIEDVVMSQKISTEFEVVSTNPKQVSIGGAVKLIGFGCTNFNRFLPPFDLNESKIDPVIRKIDRFSSHYLARIQIFGDSAFCDVDSGGGVYKLDSDKDGAYRVIVGIATSSDKISNSIAASTAHPDFMYWAYEWLNESTSRQICGLSRNHKGCKGL